MNPLQILSTTASISPRQTPSLEKIGYGLFVLGLIGCAASALLEFSLPSASVPAYPLSQVSPLAFTPAVPGFRGVSSPASRVSTRDAPKVKMFVGTKSAKLKPSIGGQWPAADSRHRTSQLNSLRMQQGPLEDGFKELLPLSTDEGNVDPELVERVDLEVQELMGVGLDELLNPSKVVNLEREKVLLDSQLAQPPEALDSEARTEVEARLAKVEKDLFREKRTVFRGWLKNLFVGQAILTIGISGLAVFDQIPGVKLDLAFRALGFWSYWLFTIPSLRASRPTGWQKKALNAAFLGSPIVTLGLPFVTKDPPTIWAANLALLGGCYAYGYLTGDADEDVGSFSGPLRWLDFGSGQERGISKEKRESLAAKQQQSQQQQQAEADKTESEKESTP